MTSKRDSMYFVLVLGARCARVNKVAVAVFRVHKRSVNLYQLIVKFDIAYRTYVVSKFRPTAASVSG